MQRFRILGAAIRPAYAASSSSSSSSSSSVASCNCGAARSLATAVSPGAAGLAPSDAASGPAESIEAHRQESAANSRASSSSPTLAPLSSSSSSSSSSFSPITSRRAPAPLSPEQASLAQTIHLPNLIFRLVRNGPKEKNNPFVATFRVPVQLTKPDIVSYLAQVYGLRVTSINTVIEMGEIVKAPPGSYKAIRRKKSTKKAIVGMEEPFWFPEMRPAKFLNDNYEKDIRKNYLTRRILPVGDGGPGRGRRSWRWRGADPSVQGIGSRYNKILLRIKERRDQQERFVKGEAKKERAELEQSMQNLSVQ